MIWIIVALCIIILVCAFIIWNLYDQVGILEKEVMRSGEVEDSAVRVYEYMIKVFTEALNQMNRVDKNGAYSSDDEVGFAFRVVIDSIEQVKLQIEKLRVNEEEDA